MRPPGWLLLARAFYALRDPYPVETGRPPENSSARQIQPTSFRGHSGTLAQPERIDPRDRRTACGIMEAWTLVLTTFGPTWPTFAEPSSGTPPCSGSRSSRSGRPTARTTRTSNRRRRGDLRRDGSRGPRRALQLHRRRPRCTLGRAELTGSQWWSRSSIRRMGLESSRLQTRTETNSASCGPENTPAALLAQASFANAGPGRPRSPWARASTASSRHYGVRSLRPNELTASLAASPQKHHTARVAAACLFSFRGRQ